MVKVAPDTLERELYQDECMAWQGKSSAIKYYVVTDSKRFAQQLCELMDNKKRNREDKLKAVVEKTRKTVLQTMEDEEPVITRETITTDVDQRIDVIRYPIIEGAFNSYTPFEGQKSPIAMFRVSPGDIKSAPRSWLRLTKADLDQLYEQGGFGQGKNNSLVRLENLLVEGIDGNELTRARKMLLPGTNDSILALRAMRSALEYSLRRYSRLHFIRRNEKVVEAQDRNYLGFAYQLGIISASDFNQGSNVIGMANRAVHHEYMDIQGATAKIALHWCIEFIGKTLGYHRLDKSRAQGTIFAPEFTFTLDQPEYRLRRAILDQGQVLKGPNMTSAGKLEFITLGKESFPREQVIASCQTLFRETKKRIPESALGATEKRFGQILMGYNPLEGRPGHRDKHTYTGQDAIRAAMFVYSLIHHSKETDVHQLLHNTTPLDTEDHHMQLAIRRGGKTQTRFEKYKLGELEKAYGGEIDMLRKIVKDIHSDTLTPLEMLQGTR